MKVRKRLPRKYRCALCRQRGHNRRKCRRHNPVYRRNLVEPSQLVALRRRKRAR